MEQVVIAMFIQPPSSLNKLILDLQTNLGTLTASKFNLIFPPHITMRSGLEVSSNQVFEFTAKFKDLLKSVEKPKLKITSVSFDDNSSMGKGYWIGLDVQKSSELEAVFNLLQSEFNEYNSFPNLKSFKPHFSLAFNDLTKEGYEKAKAYLETQNLSNIFVEFELDYVTVFTSDANRKDWVLADKIYFAD